MITLRAKFKNGQIAFIDSVPFSGEHDVLITFMSHDSQAVEVSKDDLQELKTLIRESGLVLSPKELEILRLAQSGKKIEEIAETLEISHGSARNHLSSVYAKLKVQNRTEAIHKAIRLGLLDSTESLFD